MPSGFGTDGYQGDNRYISVAEHRESATLAAVLEKEQYRSLTRLVPILYGLVIIVTAALCFSARNIAPVLYTLYLPLGLLCVIVFRLFHWIRARQHVDDLAAAAIRRHIMVTGILGPVISLSFTLIGIAAMMHGDAKHLSLTVVTIWMAAITCGLCLYALPRAAALVVTASGLPLSIWFLIQNNEFMITLAALVVLFNAIFIYLLSENWKAFLSIVRSRMQIAEQHQRAEAAKDSATSLANTDFLTKLSNRRHFELQLASRVVSRHSLHEFFAVGIIDLDGFKPINDAYGHAVGDAFLIEVARRLKEVMSGRGTIARVGGDEFAVIGDGVRNSLEALELGNHIQSAFAPMFSVGQFSTPISCSCGFAIFPMSGDEPNRLIDQADMALYRCKSRERGGIAIFEPIDETLALENAIIERALRKAVAEDSIEVNFQPIIDLPTGEISGFEALARWHDPALGQVSPADFIPIAERIGIIESLSDLLLAKAARAASRWPDNLMLSFNLSASEISRPGAWTRIESTVRNSGLPLERFEVEITETAILKDLLNARGNIDGLRLAGIHIALDDFGTGHSSLSHLRDLPLDRIKIDKSFVDSLGADVKVGSMVNSLVEMCHQLDFECVAEGIESSDQLLELKLAGCKYGQGYLFSKPMAKERIGEYLTRHSCRIRSGVAADS